MLGNNAIKGKGWGDWLDHSEGRSVHRFGFAVFEFGLLDEKFGLFVNIWRNSFLDATKGIKLVLGKDTSPTKRCVDIGGASTVFGG